MQLQGELDAKRAELAKELEEGMQRDFEIRRLNAQTELLLKELETAKRFGFLFFFVRGFVVWLVGNSYKELETAID